MKQTFSTHWIASSQPRKQRKYRANAPLHLRSHFLHVHLAKDLRQKYSTRSLRIRSGDEVRVLRGQFSGRTGKVDRVDAIRMRVFVSGVESMKLDGTKKPYPMQASNLMITKLVDDKRRLPGAEKPAKAAKETAPRPQKQAKPAAKTKAPKVKA